MCRRLFCSSMRHGHVALLILVSTFGLYAGAQDSIASPKKATTSKKVNASKKPTPAKEPTEDKQTVKSEPVTEGANGENKKPDLAPAGAPDAKDQPTILENLKSGAEDVAKDVAVGAEKVQQSLNTARENRSARDWTITGNYSLIEMWVVTKYGFTLGWNRSPASTYEFEFMRGSIGLGKYGIDLADISETRMSLLWRSYGQRQSFNFITGLYYNELKAGFGSDYLSTVPGGYVDVLLIKTLGLTWGLGNRWITKNGYVWGFDWFSIHVPVLILDKNDAFTKSSTSAEYREDVDDAISIFSRIPAVGVLKVQLGFSW